MIARGLAAGVGALSLWMLSTGTATAAPGCGPRAAAELERRLPVRPFRLDRRLGQTMCFDFTGDGRKDIVFTGWEAMNHGAHYWAAFRATRSEWRRVKFKHSCCRADPRIGAGIQIARSGRTIVITQPNYRRDDPACCPTGGVNEGRWRWKRGWLNLIRAATSSS